MNGDTVEQILEYLDGEGADLPKNVTNSMLLIASREQYQTTKYFYDETDKQLGKITKMVEANIARISSLEQAQAVQQVRNEVEQKAEDKQEATKDKKFDKRMKLVEAVQNNAGVGAILGVLAVKITEWLYSLFQ